MTKPATAEAAFAAPLTHSVAGDGKFVDYGSSPSLGGYIGLPVLAIPHPPSEGSAHELRAAIGSTAGFRWAEGVWWPVSLTMLRLAFTPEWLGSRGWSYVGAITEDETIQDDPSAGAEDKPSTGIEDDSRPSGRRSKNLKE